MPSSRKDLNEARAGWRYWWRGRLPLESETAVFILLNVFDVFLTTVLVYYFDGFNEGNPVARFFLNHWGLTGLIYYKMAMVAFICVIVQLIATRSLRTARRLLYGLSAIVGGVVLYSSLLVYRAL